MPSRINHRVISNNKVIKIINKINVTQGELIRLKFRRENKVGLNKY